MAAPVLMVDQPWVAGYRAVQVLPQIVVHRLLESPEDLEDVIEVITEILQTRAELLGCNTVVGYELGIDLGPPMTVYGAGTPTQLERID